MILISAIWQKLVWCALIGGVIGLVFGVIGLFQRTAAQANDSIAIDLGSSVLVGTLFGLILLGVPASLWVFGKWAFHGGKLTPPAAVVTTATSTVSPTAHQVTEGAGHAAMVGSTAAVPAAVIGAVGGLVLAALGLGLIGVLSILIGPTWYNDIVNHYLFSWFAVPSLFGGVVGFLAGTFLGGAVGAIVGGVRALSRH